MEEQERSSGRVQRLTTMPCPECRDRGVAGWARIGNYRSKCATCNLFAQRVMQRCRAELKRLHEEEYREIRLQVEVDLYPSFMDHYFALREEQERQRNKPVVLDENGMPVSQP